MKKSIVLPENIQFLSIPREILGDERLKAEEKIVLSEIYSLCNLEKGCIASNKYFANFIGGSERSVQDYLKHFEELGYIKRELVYKENSKEIDKRIIYYVNNGKNNSKGWCENSREGGARNCADNNIELINNNILNILNSSEELSTKPVKKKFDDMTESEKKIETERWRNEVLPKVVYGICTHDNFIKIYPNFKRKIPENYIETITSAIQEYTSVREKTNRNYMIFGNDSIKKAVDQTMMFFLDDNVEREYIKKYIFSEMIEKFFNTKSKTLGCGNAFRLGMFFDKDILLGQYALTVGDEDLRRELFDQRPK